MSMRTHEIHPALVHAPLTLLPAAALVDLTFALRGRRRQGGLGASLWKWATFSGLVAGVTGMAASQEVTTPSPRARDIMWTHGMGNLTLVIGAAAMARWRLRHPPSLPQATLGLLATTLGLYTAYLGGEMVYSEGVGVKSVPITAPSPHRSPPVASLRMPIALVRDGVAGLRWLLGRAAQLLRGRGSFEREAIKVKLRGDDGLPEQPFGL